VKWRKQVGRFGVRDAEIANSFGKILVHIGAEERSNDSHFGVYADKRQFALTGSLQEVLKRRRTVVDYGSACYHISIPYNINKNVL
jgi:hypothetical protein